MAEQEAWGEVKLLLPGHGLGLVSPLPVSTSVELEALLWDETTEALCPVVLRLRQGD